MGHLTTPNKDIVKVLLKFIITYIFGALKIEEENRKTLCITLVELPE